MDEALGSLRAAHSQPSRARDWIFTAFHRLVVGRGYRKVSVGELARRAGVGRSTFYEHFRDKDELLRQALAPILAPLADAAVGAGDVGRVRFVLEHLAENRGRARELLEGPARASVERALAELIRLRLDGGWAEAAELDAVRLAGGQIAVLGAWLGQGGAVDSSRAAEVLVRRG